MIDDEFAQHISETSDQLLEIIMEEMDCLLENGDTNDSTPNEALPESVTDVDHKFQPVSSPYVGDQLEFYWSEDDVYYPGVVGESTTDGQHVVRFDDVDAGTLSITNEQWRYSNSLNQKPKVCREMTEMFGNKPFLLHHAQSVPKHVIY